MQPLTATWPKYRIGLLTADLVQEIKERLSHDHPAVRKAVEEVLHFCGGVGDFEASFLYKKGAHLMAKIREDERRQREAESSAREQRHMEQDEQHCFAGASVPAITENERETGPEISGVGSSSSDSLALMSGVDVVTVAAGYYHSAVCTSDGALWCWFRAGDQQSEANPCRLDRGHFGGSPVQTESFLTFNTTVCDKIGLRLKDRDGQVAVEAISRGAQTVSSFPRSLAALPRRHPEGSLLPTKDQSTRVHLEGQSLIGHDLLIGSVPAPCT